MKQSSDHRESAFSRQSKRSLKQNRKFSPRPNRKFLFTVTIVSTLVGALFGASVRMLLAASPFSSNANHLPHAAQTLTALVPATLSHPVTLLVLGIDNDDDHEHPHFSTESNSSEALAHCSDTMLLVRFLPDQHQINVLSIPRDTLVTLPGTDVAKIDWANLQGGAQLAAQTVGHQLGRDVQIDRYIRLSRNGFVRLVDVLGGIEVNIPKQMDYTDNAQHLNIHFSPGRQKLGGRRMEEYVRFRHDELGDIGRVQRQQEVLKAILATMMQPEMVAKLPEILQVAQQNIDTDLSMDEMLALVHAALTTERSHNNFLMLPGRFSRPDEYALSFWIEEPEAAAPILTRYFNGTTPTASNNSSPTLNQAMNVSDVSSLKVAVANATGRSKLDEQIVAQLKHQGYGNVYTMTDYETDLSSNSNSTTKIIAQHGNPEAANAVQHAIGVGEVQVSATGDIYSDVTIVVGTDLLAKFNIH